MKIQLRAMKWRQLTTTFVFAIAVIGGQFAHVDMAHAAANAVWIGTTGDNKFSTAGNWQGGVLPTAGDILVFGMPAAGSVATEDGLAAATLDNDLDLAFGGLKSDTAQSGFNYRLSKVLKLTSGATFTPGAYSQFVETSTAGVIALGDLTVKGCGSSYGDCSWPAINSIAGALTLSTGAQLNIGNLTPTLINLDGGTIRVDSNDNSVISSPVHVLSESYISASTQEAANSLTLTGKVTADATLLVSLSSQATVKFTGEVVNKGNIKKTTTSSDTGKLLIGADAVEVPAKSVSFDGDAPTTAQSVENKTTATLNGSRGAIFVNTGGVLNGTGTAAYLSVSGIVAPGHSPGTLTVLNSFNLGYGGTYQAEIKDVNNYDKLSVGKDYAAAFNAVQLDPESNLALSLYDGWKINQGDTFTIIDNLSSTPVGGTFKGLPEGAKIDINDMTFQISYVGGDGNDVVLTALKTAAAPSAPNTAVANFVKANPAVIVVAGLVAAAAVFMASRRRA